MSLKLHTWGNESLPAIFCIHGWALNAQVFQPLAELFSEHFHFVAVDLPGFGESESNNPANDYDLDNLMNAIVEVAPDNAIWLGWSLGGMLAMQAAARYPEKVSKVLTLCSNAKFLADKKWKNGVPQPLFDGFMNEIDDVKTTLRRFAALTVVGEQKGMLNTLKWLQQNAQSQITQSDVLKVSLELLATIDNRKLYPLITQPCLHMLATDDSIVPNKVSQDINNLNPKHMTSFVPNGSHASLVSQPQSVANGILAFVQGQA